MHPFAPFTRIPAIANETLRLSVSANVMATSEIIQEAEQGRFSVLPVELTARVMSLLPVPVFITCRSVCKAWNKLLRRPEFLERKHEESYLCLTAQLSAGSSTWVDPAYMRTTWLLDLNLR